MAANDEIYELNEDDEQPPHSERLDADGTYALGEEATPPPREASPDPGGGTGNDPGACGEAGMEVRDARYCLACGFDLSEIDTGVCPGCEKAFDPNDPLSYRDTPLVEAPVNWWFDRPRVAGYILLALFPIGRWLIHVVADDPGGRFAAAIMGMGALVFVAPWAGACASLGLAAVAEHHNPKVSTSVALGMGFGVLVTIGLHPALSVVGAFAGAFAGFVRAWRQI